MRTLVRRCVSYLLLASSCQFKSTFGLDITLSFSDTDRPTPDSSLIFTLENILVDDPANVTVYVRDTRRGNETRLFSHNVQTESPSVGFALELFPTGPGYILRLDDPRTNTVVATSRPFEIFPIGTPPSFTFQPEPSSLPAPSQSSSAPNEPPEDAPESKLPLGTIIGGAVGGFAVLVLFFVLLWLLLDRREKKRSPPTHLDASHASNARMKKPGDKDVISPFILPTNNGSHPESIPMTASSNSQTRYGEYNSASNEKARLKARLANQPKYFDAASSSGQTSTPVFERAPSAGGVSSDHLLSSSHSDHSSHHRRAPSSSKSAAIRADQLRRERERIDQEIAQLEQASVYSGSGGAGGSKPRQSEDARRGQIAALRDQVSRLDRAHEGYTPIDEPPPEYVARRTLPPPPQ